MLSCYQLPGKDMMSTGQRHERHGEVSVWGCEPWMITITRRIVSSLSLSFSLLKRPHIITPRTMSTKTIAILDHADLKDGQMYGPNRAAHSRQ